MYTYIYIYMVRHCKQSQRLAACPACVSRASATCMSGACMSSALDYKEFI